MSWPELDVTDEFRKQARDVMRKNKGLNGLVGRTEKDPGYKIDSQAMLALALTRLLNAEVSQKQVSNVLGPVRPGSKWDRIDRSTFVEPIAQILGIERMVTVQVPESRVETVKLVLALTDEALAEFDETLRTAHETVFK